MEKIELPDSEWRQRLTPEQYSVLRQGGTERAFAGIYDDNKTPGEYHCAGCGSLLFTSTTLSCRPQTVVVLKLTVIIVFCPGNTGCFGEKMVTLSGKT